MWSSSNSASCKVQILDQDHLTTWKLKLLGDMLISACNLWWTKKGAVNCSSHRKHQVGGHCFVFLKKKRKKERKKLIKSEWTTIYELDLIFSECFYCVLIQSDKEVLCQRQLAGNTNCEMCGCLNNYPHAKPHKCNCHSVSFGKERVKRCPGKWSKK